MRPALLGAAIVGVTLVKALVVARFVNGPRAFEDVGIAEALVRRGEFVYLHLGQANHTLQFPTYPLSLAAIFRVFGVQPVAALLFNVVLHGAAAWVLAQLAIRWLRDLDPPGHLNRVAPWIVWLTALGSLLHPPLNQYVMTSIHPLALDMLAFYLAMLGGYWYCERGERTQDLAALGVLAGGVLLTRTVMLAGFAPLLVWVARRAGWAAALRRAAVVLAVALAVSTPWLARNYLRDGIVGYTSTAPEILWKGVLRGTDGSNYVTETRNWADTMDVGLRARVERMTVAEQHAYFLGEYLHTVRTEPARVAGMFAMKFRNFFWFRALFGNEYGPALRRLIPLYKAVYGVLLAGGVVSLLVFRGRPWVVWVPMLALGLAQALFYVETRHRVAVEPMLLFLSLASVAAGLARRSQAVC